MDSSVAVLLGGAIGAISSIATIYVQQKFAHKRDICKMATELAVAEFNWATDLANRNNTKVMLPPLSSYVIYHSKILEAVNNGVVTPEKMAEIKSESDRILDSLEIGDPIS